MNSFSPITESFQFLAKTNEELNGKPKEFSENMDQNMNQNQDESILHYRTTPNTVGDDLTYQASPSVIKSD